MYFRRRVEGEGVLPKDGVGPKIEHGYAGEENVAAGIFGNLPTRAGRGPVILDRLLGNKKMQEYLLFDFGGEAEQAAG